MNWMKRVLSFGLSLMCMTGFCLMCMTGCEALSPEANSGDDRDRLGAVKVELNQTILDYVSCIDGDKTDWKYFTVPFETRIAVTFAFDDPAAGGTLEIFKATGVRMYEIPFVRGSRITQEFDAVPGHYYLKLSCETLKSEYTVEVSIPQ